MRYPIDTYQINDNTKSRNLANTNEGPVFFSPFISDKGLDGVITTWDDRDRFLAEYGDPDISIHGQAFAQCENILKSGGVLKAIRVTAKNAVNANIAVVLNIKVLSEQKTNAAGENLFTDATTGEETTVSAGNEPILVKKATVKHVLKTFVKPTTDPENLDALLRTLYNEGTPESGVDIPLFGAVCNGKGVYGEMFRFRLTPDIKSDINVNFRRHMFTLMKNENGLSQYGVSLRVSSASEAKDREGYALFFQDVIRRNEFPVIIRSLPESYNRAIALLHPIIAQADPKIRPDEIDIYTFVDKNMNKYKNITIDPESVDFTIPEGIGLQNGSDGDFSRMNLSRDDAINDRLIDLFRGTIDKRISDRKKLNFAIALDANFPLEVKREMVSLLERRKNDFVLVLDANKILTVANAKAFLTEELDLNNKNIVTYINNFDILENNTKRIVNVTTNYLVALLLPKHIITKGSQTPFAGLDIPLDEYIINDSIKPVMDEIDELEIYDLNGNYIHEEGGKTIFATLKTRQKEESELSYFQNVLVLNEMVADLHDLSSLFRYRFNGSEDDLRILNKMAASKMEKYRDTKCKAAEAIVTKNPNDATGKRVKTKVRTGFRQFTLGNDVEIDIDFL